MKIIKEKQKNIQKLIVISKLFKIYLINRGNSFFLFFSQNKFIIYIQNVHAQFLSAGSSRPPNVDG